MAKTGPALPTLHNYTPNPPTGGFFVARTSPMLTINFKRGDTFRLTGVYKVDGAAAALPTSIKAQLRDASDTLVAELSVDRTDESGGKYELSCADSSAWVPGRTLYGDVQFTDSTGAVLSTETYAVNVQADVTHA